MQMLKKSLVAMAFFSFLLLVQPSQAETSDDFNELDLFFYGDLDNGNGHVKLQIGNFLRLKMLKRH